MTRVKRPIQLTLRVFFLSRCWFSLSPTYPPVQSPYPTTQNYCHKFVRPRFAQSLLLLILDFLWLCLMFALLFAVFKCHQSCLERRGKCNGSVPSLLSAQHRLRCLQQQLSSGRDVTSPVDQLLLLLPPRLGQESHRD